MITYICEKVSPNRVLRRQTAVEPWVAAESSPPNMVERLLDKYCLRST